MTKSDVLAGGIDQLGTSALWELTGWALACRLDAEKLQLILTKGIQHGLDAHAICMTKAAPLNFNSDQNSHQIQKLHSPH